MFNMAEGPMAWEQQNQNGKRLLQLNAGPQVLEEVQHQEEAARSVRAVLPSLARPLGEVGQCQEEEYQME